MKNLIFHLFLLLEACKVLVASKEAVPGRPALLITLLLREKVSLAWEAAALGVLEAAGVVAGALCDAEKFRGWADGIQPFPGTYLAA